MAGSQRPEVWRGALMGATAGSLVVGLTWLGVERLEKARLFAASTFSPLRLEILTTQLLWIAAGAIIALLMFAVRSRPAEAAPMLLGAMAPLLAVLLIGWDFLGPALLPSSWTIPLRWTFDAGVQSIAAVGIGVLGTALVRQRRSADARSSMAGVQAADVLG